MDEAKKPCECVGGCLLVKPMGYTDAQFQALKGGGLPQGVYCRLSEQQAVRVTPPKLSEQLRRDHESGDFGRALAGYAERAASMEDRMALMEEELEALRLGEGARGPIAAYYLLAEELGVKAGGSVVDTVHATIAAAKAREREAVERAERAEKRAEYWKAEHNAANAEVARRESALAAARKALERAREEERERIIALLSRRPFYVMDGPNNIIGGQRLRAALAPEQKGCPLDTDGDGNCPIHPEGCPDAH